MKKSDVSTVEVLYSAVPDDIVCEVCGGSGKFIIRNAYDDTFEGEEKCWECSGLGIQSFFSAPLVKI